MLKFALIAALVCLVAADTAKLDGTKRAESIELDAKKLDALRAITEVRSAEVEWNETVWGPNPCETRRNFNYYLAFPNDTARYIRCDPWGSAIVRTCVDGTEWNMWALRCDISSEIRNVTFVLPHRVFNCSLSGQQCLNEGVCTESSLGGDRCVCKPLWTGLNCETPVDNNDLAHEILNGTFSWHKFRQEVAALNLTVDVSSYEVFKSQLDAAAYAELQKYISLYNGTEVRYDTLINNLVERILSDIYPDAAYLSAFNASAVSVVDLVELIPHLMSYSKYSLERYQDVFAKYHQVLDTLIEYLNSTRHGHPHLREEARAYARVTAIFLNQTVEQQQAAGQQTPSNINDISSFLEHRDETHDQLSEDQIIESLRVQFNQTLSVTQQLFLGLDAFQHEIADLIQKGDQSVYSLTLDQSKLNGTAVIVDLLNQISTASVHVWDQLVNYGFWYITSMLTTPIHELIAQHEAVMAHIANATQVQA
jgi:hypothetical protein